MHEWLEDNAPTWKEVVAVFVRAGQGLDAAHRAGLVHRDFKPHNVLVDSHGRVKVVDFGLARAHDDPSSSTSGTASLSDAALAERLTQADRVVGTPRYMAPEQFDKAPVGPAADQFGFCVALYKALFRQWPFPAGGFQQLLHAVRRNPPQPAPKGTKVPARIRKAIFKGLRRRPDQRHASMDALLSQLQPRRIPIMPIAIGAAVVAAGVLALALPDSEPSAACSGDAALGDLFSAEQREGIASGFATASPRYGEQAWARVDQATQARLDAWTEAYDRTCAARGEPNADARFACLHRLRARYAAMAERLEGGETHVVYSAVSAALALPQVSECDAPEQEPPELRTIRERVGDVRTQLALGDPEQAEALVRRLWESPERVDTPAARALILEVYGASEAALGRDREAKERLEQAHAAASEAGEDRSAARSASALMSLAADDGKVDEALDWARHAEAALDRVPSALSVRVDFLDRRAHLERQRGHVDAAIEQRREAVAAAREIEPQGGPNVATVIANLATDYRAAGRLTDSIDTHEDALQMRRKWLGTGHPEVGLSLLGLGTARSQLGELDQAEAHLREALRLYEEAYGEDSPRLIPPLGNLGNAVSAQDRQEEALAIYERTLALVAKAHGEDSPRIVPWLSNSAVALRGLGRFDEAIARQVRALALETATWGDKHPGVARTRVMLGATYEDAGDLPSAARTYDQALEVLRTDPTSRTLLGQTLYRRARVHHRAGETRRAREQLTKSIEILRAAESATEDLDDARKLLAELND